MKKDVSREDLELILEEDEIRQEVKNLAFRLEESYRDQQPVVLIGVLKGSFIFMSDLVREINLPITCDFMRVSSYGTSTESSGVVRFEFDLTSSIEGRHVVLVEDIIDTGNTIDYLLKNFRTRDPKSLAVCTLLHKPARMEKEVQIDYKGFEIPNRFVVGYGLDYAEKFRHLPYVAALPEKFE